MGEYSKKDIEKAKQAVLLCDERAERLHLQGKKLSRIWFAVRNTNAEIAGLPLIDYNMYREMERQQILSWMDTEEQNAFAQGRKLSQRWYAARQTAGTIEIKGF